MKEQLFKGLSFGSIQKEDQEVVLSRLSALDSPVLKEGDSRSLYCLVSGTRSESRLIECDDYQDAFTLKEFKEKGIYSELLWYMGFSDEVTRIILKL